MSSSGLKPWPRIGLGCATLGTPAPWFSDADAETVLHAAIDRGVRLFDVAPLYGGGVAEERLGRALSSLSRDEYVLCTKTGVSRPYGELAKPPGATRRRQFDRWDYSAKATRASIVASLARLNVDRLDVVHLHDVDDHLDVCLQARDELSALAAEGVVGAIGIGSNAVDPVSDLLVRASFDAFLLAGCYTLLDQSGGDLMARAAGGGVRVIAGGVFNSGMLATWPNPNPTFGYLPAPPRIVARTARLATVCRRHAVPIGAAALQFVIANPAVTTVLIGPRSVAELEQNLAAIELDIPESLWQELEHEALIPRGCPWPRWPLRCDVA